MRLGQLVSRASGPGMNLAGGSLFGRGDPVRKFTVRHGDVAVWGGPSRLYYHGVAELKEGEHEFLGRLRINLTFRWAL